MYFFTLHIRNRKDMGRITEQELFRHGFTEKDINKLKDALSRNKTGNDTYESLMSDLKGRFLKGVFCILLIILFFILFLYSYGTDDIIFFIVITIFSLFTVYISVPMNLAWKARRFISKRV